MKSLLVLIFGLLAGMLIAGIRMTDDKKQDEFLKVKRISDGVVMFVPKDDDYPYVIGDIYEERKNTEIGLLVLKYVVVDDIKVK